MRRGTAGVSGAIAWARSAWARAAWAGRAAEAVRAALGQAAEAGPWARRATPEAAGVTVEALGEGVRRLQGPLTVNPMSGAVFAGRRRLDLGPEARPTDWLVQAFPSPLRLGAVCPLWYGAEGEAPETALETALARAIALARVSPGTEALVALPLGRAAAFQEALARGAFGEVPARVHAWDKAPTAEAVVTVPSPTAADLREARERLSKSGR